MWVKLYTTYTDGRPEEREEVRLKGAMFKQATQEFAHLVASKIRDSVMTRYDLKTSKVPQIVEYLPNTQTPEPEQWRIRTGYELGGEDHEITSVIYLPSGDVRDFVDKNGYMKYYVATQDFGTLDWNRVARRVKVRKRHKTFDAATFDAAKDEAERLGRVARTGHTGSEPDVRGVNVTITLLDPLDEHLCRWLLKAEYYEENTGVLCVTKTVIHRAKSPLPKEINE